MAINKNSINNNNHIPISSFPIEIINQILSYNNLSSAISFLRTSKTYYKNSYLWREQLFHQYGFILKNPDEAQAALKSISHYEKHKSNKDVPLELIMAMNFLLKLNENEDWPSIFLSEMYLYGYSCKADLTICYIYLVKAVGYYKNHPNINSAIINKLANTIYNFQNYFIDFLLESNISFTWNLEGRSPISLKDSFMNYKQLRDFLTENKKNIDVLRSPEKNYNGFIINLIEPLILDHFRKAAEISEFNLIYDHIYNNCNKSKEAILRLRNNYLNFLNIGLKKCTDLMESCLLSHTTNPDIDFIKLINEKIEKILPLINNIEKFHLGISISEFLKLGIDGFGQ